MNEWKLEGVENGISKSFCASQVISSLQCCYLHMQIKHKRRVSARQNNGLGSHKQACLSNLLKFTLRYTRKQPSNQQLRHRLHPCDHCRKAAHLHSYGDWKAFQRHPLTHQPPHYIHKHHPASLLSTHRVSTWAGGGRTSDFRNLFRTPTVSADGNNQQSSCYWSIIL